MHIALLGATGRTGTLFLEGALDAGHTVRALVRGGKQPARAGHERLEVVPGEATTVADVTKVCEGADVVVACLASSNKETVCSQATANVVVQAENGGPTRYLAVSGAGVDVPGDEKGVGDRVVGAIMGVVVGKMLADRQREYERLVSSPLNWTLARPPRLIDGDARDYRTSLQRPQATSVTRAAVAQFLLDNLDSDEFAGKAPFVSA